MNKSKLDAASILLGKKPYTHVVDLCPVITHILKKLWRKCMSKQKHLENYISFCKYHPAKRTEQLNSLS